MNHPLLQSTKTALLGLVRRGPRTVLWTPENVRLGNFFYYWLYAHTRQSHGDNLAVLETPRMQEWRNAFPYLFESLVLPRADLRLTDRRADPGALQTYGTDFDGRELATFIDSMLLDRRSALVPHIAAHEGTHDLTVNVRRGDYYSVPKWRGEYSFDVVEYIRLAVSQALSLGPITSVLLVSDDLAWCGVKLAWLEGIAPVSTLDRQVSPLEQLAAIAASRRLILANSTFSYWGGYLNQHLNSAAPDAAPSAIWAPRFHNRAMNGGRAVQLDPRWNIIEDIPAGWDG